MFQAGIDRLEETTREDVMQIVTSWMEEGIQQGMQRERNLLLRLLHHRFGALPPEMQSPIDQLSLTQLENLAVALLDFTDLTDLQAWLTTELRPDRG